MSHRIFPLPHSPHSFHCLLFHSFVTPSVAAANTAPPPQNWARILGAGQTTHGMGQVPTSPAVIANVPEPATVLGLLGFGSLILGLKRKQSI